MVPHDSMRKKKLSFEETTFRLKCGQNGVAPRLILEANGDMSLKPKQYET